MIPLVGEANREGIVARRGTDERGDVFLLRHELRIAANHPLRAIRRLADAALTELDRAHQI
jgi:hypothetical protein